MTLWNIIRDFFVEYIFGGYNSNSEGFEGNMIGYLCAYENGEQTVDGVVDVNNLWFDVGKEGPFAYSLSVGDWLSTTATIITLCAICVFLFFFVRWLFRLTAGLVSGRG